MVNSSLVTVIVPVYNVERYLTRCLDSIVNQTYHNIEIILVNDGSTDGSGEICRQYAERDSRIRLFTQKNQGLSAARNVGLDQMTGEYIVFVDSDDYISLSLIEILLRQLTEYHTQMSVCGRKIVHEEELEEGQVYSNHKIKCKLLSRDNVYAMMGEPKGDPFVVVWGKLYTRVLFEKLRFDLGKVNEDEFIYHKILNQVDKLCYTEAPLYNRVLSRESITRQDGIKHFHADAVEAFFGRLEYFQEYGNKKYIKKMEKMIIGLVIRLCEQDNVGSDQTKKALDQTKRKIEQTTGKTFISARYYLYHISPIAYRFARTVRLRMKLVLAKLHDKQKYFLL